jgi:restriction system protein
MRKLLSVAVMTAFPLMAQAHADRVFHTTATVHACVDPRVTRVLADPATLRQHGPDWVRGMLRTGRCFEASPSEAWDEISGSETMVLLRRDPPKVGMPPLYFMREQISFGTQKDEQPDSPQSAGPVLPPGWEKPNLPPADEAGGSDILGQVAALRGMRLDGFFGLAALVTLYVVWRIARRLNRRRRAWRLIVSEIDQQAGTLQVRRLQLTAPDRYGTVNLSKWQREIEYFCKTRLLTILAGDRLGDQWQPLSMRAVRHIEMVSALVPPVADPATGPPGDPAVFDPAMDPLLYEHHCALLLRRAGWDARTTPASGDQGADVIAMRAGRKIVVQCKLHSQPVGNRAVQEAFAAGRHQRAHAALVVSNAGFTQSARQLAHTTGVLLLHHRELGTFRMPQPVL